MVKSSASGLSLWKELSGFSVTKEVDEFNGSEEYTESSLVEIWMYLGTDIEIPSGIRSISLVAMYIDP